jgi:hypothetical protein
MIRARLFLLLRVLWLLAIQLPAQEEPEQIRTRRIWDSNFLEQRPAPGKPPAARPTPPRSRDQAAFVGITIWRMRPATSADNRAARAVIDEDGVEREYTPERVAAARPLLEGQKLRIGIETARAGYLYVVDRDEYADKSRSDPYLIFPTARTRGGDNRVSGGIVVEIPGAADEPPYFRVERTRPDQTAEVLTILVSPKPIEGIRIGPERLKLSPAQLAAWEKQWMAKSYPLDSPGQAGQAYTMAEKEAAEGKKILSKDDPLPQTMYRVEAKSGAPVMISLPLTISR